MSATYDLIDESQIGDDCYDDPQALAALFETRTYTVRDGVLSRQ